MALGQREQTVLHILREKGGISRSDLAIRLNVTRAAVTMLVNDMLERGLLIEQGEWHIENQLPSRGRRKRMVCINPNFKLALGITITPQTIFAGLSNLDGEVIDKLAVPNDCSDYRGLLEKLMSVINGIVKNNCISFDKLVGVGLSSEYSFNAKYETAAQSLTVLKKDLSHAAAVDFYCCETAEGVLRAEQLFGKEQGAMIVIGLNQKLKAAFGKDDSVFIGENGGLLSEVGGEEELVKALELFDISRVYGYSENNDRVKRAAEIILKLSNDRLNVKIATASQELVFLAGAAIAVEKGCFDGMAVLKA